MAGPRYTIAQTRARVAALEIAAQHLSDVQTNGEVEQKQFDDVIRKLLNEATRLKAKAQETRRNAHQDRDDSTNHAGCAATDKTA